MSIYNLKSLESFLSTEKENKSYFNLLSENSCMRTLYEETKHFHNDLSDTAIVNFVYLVSHIGKEGYDIISLEHLKIFFSQIRFIDMNKSYVQLHKKQKAEINTPLIIEALEKHFSFEERKEIFTASIKSTTIKTVLFKINYKEYFGSDSIPLLKGIMLKELFIKGSELYPSEKGSIEEKILNYIKKNLKHLKTGTKIIFFEKYKEIFSKEDFYEAFETFLENSDLSIENCVLKLSEDIWLDCWEKYSKNNKKPLNNVIDDVYTKDFFKLKSLSDTKISEEKMAGFLISLGYNFEGNSLSYEYLHTIKNKKQFINNTLILSEIKTTGFGADTDLKMQIASLERLIPPLEKIKIMSEFKNKIIQKENTNFIASLNWDFEIKNIFKDYLFEYCEDDLSIKDDMFSLLLMKYAI